MTKDQKAFYKPEEAIYHNDGREERLLQFIRAHPGYNEMQGNATRILDAIDEYGRTTDFLMNVGSEKGKVVAQELIPKLQPDLMVELGGYVGYSALLFGAALQKAGGRKYMSFEASAKFAAISSALIELAGLDDIVEVRVGPCRDSIRQLRQEYSTGVVDVFFIDHAKLEYANDLKLCEELGLVGPGTTVIADDTNSPNIHDYLKYVQSSTSEKVTKIEVEKESVDTKGAADKSFGDPYLVYESSPINGVGPTGEPDGLEVSTCVRIESH
ncbi:catechol O-methyltransferase 1 [Penicillium nucicola]|uniref:catechol O-methyltransferase 1 n=1 Tax=Penicillium nucicola TaxID=1850975 RepID=UPI002544FFE2|nr:catechol O-methyltransferase 1 [Penicillium nucicola]KAJ5766032.1 catechol O-methyltransferase 1 [Penicillium nucicola]